MIDGNQLREEFGRYLAEHKATRWGMDAALMHVCKIAYDAGRADGPAEPERRIGPASDADMAVYRSIADGYARDTALATAEAPKTQWATCPETGTPCSRCPTNQTQCHALAATAEVPMPEPMGWYVSGSDPEHAALWLDRPDDDQMQVMNQQCDDGPVVARPLVLGADAKRYGDDREAAGYVRGLRDAVRDAAPLVQNGEVLVTVTGLTGSGKSAIAGEIEIMCRALGLEVEWGEGAAEKHLTHADWTNALEMYRPRVRIVEANIPRTDAALAKWKESK